MMVRIHSVRFPLQSTLSIHQRTVYVIVLNLFHIHMPALKKPCAISYRETLNYVTLFKNNPNIDFLK